MNSRRFNRSNCISLPSHVPWQNTALMRIKSGARYDIADAIPLMKSHRFIGSPEPAQIAPALPGGRCGRACWRS
jgi:hypothetical protein